jgi:hypothetical protein
MSATEQLSKHPFYRYLLEEVRPVVDLKEMPRERQALKKWQAQNRAHATQSQRYHYDVFSRAQNLIRVFDRLDRSASLLFSTPGFHGRRKQPLTRNDWTEYHFSVFTTALASVVDTSLLLIAEVYQLGFPPRQCTMPSVTENRWVTGSTTAAIRSLEKKLQQHRQRRNRYLHWGDEADFGDLTNSEFLQDLRTITWLHSLGKLDVDKKDLRLVWQGELENLKPKVSGAIDDALAGTQGVLTAIEKPLRDRGTLLKSKDPTPTKSD